MVVLIYTKVIIEVKNLQNNDLIGKVVLSKAGRDINHLYVVVRQIDNDYVLLANGDTKSIDMPKKKKIKHLIILENIDEELLSLIKSCDKSTDLKIKRFLKVRGIVKEG
ncbi:MAG: Ribosomal protein L14E [Clostridium butyricum DORA_1]|nr:MAG: Ribosomal protein L14E [Clostridium butyricum DORA_1]